MHTCEMHTYERLVNRKKTVKPGEEIIVDKLPYKKRGRPVLLGEKLDKHLQEMIPRLPYILVDMISLNHS